MVEKYFGYSSLSDMYTALNETTGSEENKTQVSTIENSPTSDAKKIKNRNHMLEIIEHILYFNQLNQSGQRIKTKTPN